MIFVNDIVRMKSLVITTNTNTLIWELITLFLTNQIAGNTIDFKMNVINIYIKHSKQVKLPIDDDLC